MKLDLSDLLDDDETVTLFDGFEEAAVGVARRFDRKPFVVYDRDKCLQILMRRDGMSYEEAEEFFAFNTEGCYAGESTPAILVSFTKKD